MKKSEELIMEYVYLQSCIKDLIKAYKKDKNDILKEIGTLVSVQSKFGEDLANYLQENKDN